MLIIANGRLVTSGDIHTLSGGSGAIVQTSDIRQLAGALRVADVMSHVEEDGTFVAETTDLRLIGDVALRAGLPIWELRPKQADLERLFFSLT